MGCFQTLCGGKVQEALDEAARLKAPLTVTVRRQTLWLTYRSWLARRGDGFMLLGYPTLDGQAATDQFAIGDAINLMFRVAQRRYVFCVTVLGRTRHAQEDGTKSVALKVTIPESIERVEKRCGPRLPMPDSLIARATFWLGGSASPPSDTIERPMWSGRLINLSKGGALIRANQEAAKYVETGDLTGLAIGFGEGDDWEEIVVEARFRHAAPDGEMALLGFEFVHLQDSEETQMALEAIRLIVDELCTMDEGLRERPAPAEGAGPAAHHATEAACAALGAARDADSLT